MVSKQKGEKRPRTLLTFFLASLFLQGLVPANCTVLSTELRELADTQLLFWSSFDCVIDAALNFFGPIDELIRETKEYPPRDDASSPTGVVVSDVLDINHTFIRGAKSIFTNLIRGGAKADNRLASQVEMEQFDDEQDLACSANCHATAQHEKNAWEEETQSRNHSSLQVRGGARRDRNKFEYSLYQEGDGSESDPDGIPARYVAMHNGNRELAAKSLEASLEWRKDNKIDTILARPHTKFDLCKQVFPSYFLGRDPEDHVIFLQRPALMDLELAKRNKLKKEDLLEHYIYVNEYLWQVLEADKPLGTMVSVLDLSGLNMSVLRKREYIEFLKLFVKTMDSHFPQRAHKTLIINSPKWVGTIYRLVSPLLREETKSRIEIVSKSKKQDEALKRYLGPKACQLLPESFWSKHKKSKHNDPEEEDGDGEQFSESDFDAKLRSHVSLV